MTDLLDRPTAESPAVLDVAKEDRQSWTTEEGSELVAVDAARPTDSPAELVPTGELGTVRYLRSSGQRLASTRERIVYLTIIEGFGTLRQPLKVEVQPGEDVRYVAFAPGIEIGGVGDSFFGSVRDLASTIASLYEEYSRTPTGELHESAARALARLRSALGA